MKINRVAVRHLFVKLKETYPIQFIDIDIDSIYFYIDMNEPNTIIEIIRENKSRFNFIIHELLHRSENDEQYRHVVGKVYEMRFNGRPNARILCKETIVGNRLGIIMSLGIRNKGTTDKALINKATNISAYNYKLFNNYQEYEKFKKSL